MPLNGKLEDAMTKSEALEEVDRVRDNLDRIGQELLRLKTRMDEALKAIRQSNERNAKG